MLSGGNAISVGNSTFGGIDKLSALSHSTYKSLRNVSTSAASANCDGVSSKTTTEMKTLATFSTASWDIQTTTVNLSNGHPGHLFLSWQAGASFLVWLVYLVAVVPPVPSTPNPEGTLAETGQSMGLYVLLTSSLW